MNTKLMNATQIVTTDRKVSSLADLRPIHHGFYHGVIGVIVMGLLLTSCASFSHSVDTAPLEQSSPSSEISESIPRVVQMEEVQIWNPLERSEYFTARNR